MISITCLALSSHEKQKTLTLGTALGFNTLTLFRCLVWMNERYSTFEKAVVGAGQGYYVS